MANPKDRLFFSGGKLRRSEVASTTRAIEMDAAAAWHFVKSSNVKAVAWTKTQGLCVWFGQGGSPESIYTYPSAPYDAYAAMMGAGSKGKHLNSEVIPRFPHQGPYSPGSFKLGA